MFKHGTGLACAVHSGQSPPGYTNSSHLVSPTAHGRRLVLFHQCASDSASLDGCKPEGDRADLLPTARHEHAEFGSTRAGLGFPGAQFAYTTAQLPTIRQILHKNTPCDQQSLGQQWQPQFLHLRLICDNAKSTHSPHVPHRSVKRFGIKLRDRKQSKHIIHT